MYKSQIVHYFFFTTLQLKLIFYLNLQLKLIELNLQAEDIFAPNLILTPKNRRLIFNEVIALFNFAN